MFHFYNYYHSLLLCTITLFFYLSTNCVLSVFIKRILELELELELFDAWDAPDAGAISTRTGELLEYRRIWPSCLGAEFILESSWLGTESWGRLEYGVEVTVSRQTPHRTACTLCLEKKTSTFVFLHNS